MSKRVDPDISALKGCARALEKCRSLRMVMATLEFLRGHYLANPPAERKRKGRWV